MQVTFDPFGAVVQDVFSKEIKEGADIRPTIAITRAHVDLPEIKEGIRLGRLKPDGVVLNKNGQVSVTKGKCCRLFNNSCFEVLL